MAELMIPNIAGSFLSGISTSQQQKAQQMQNKLAQMQLAQAPAQMQRQATTDALRNRLLAMQAQEAEAAPAKAQKAAEQERATGRATAYQEWMGKIANAYQQAPDAQKEEVLRVGIDQMGADMSTRGFIQSPEELLEVQNQATQAFGVPSGALLYGDKVTGKDKYSVQLTPAQWKDEQGKTVTGFVQGSAEGGAVPVSGGFAPYSPSVELSREKFEDELQQREQKLQAQAAKTVRQADNVDDLFATALGDVNHFTSGFIGSVLRNIGGTSAKDLYETVGAIQANIGFDRLQQMRDDSITGGALGQVAVQELEQLQRVLGSLNTSQSPDRLRENLKRVREQYSRAADAYRYAMAEKYGLEMDEADIKKAAAKFGLSEDQVKQDNMIKIISQSDADAAYEARRKAILGE